MNARSLPGPVSPQPTLQVNVGIPDLGPLIGGLATLTLGFDPIKVLDETIRPALRAPIFLRPVGQDDVRWYPLKIEDGRYYTRTILNGQAEVGLGYKDRSLLLLLPRSLDGLVGRKLAAIGPTHGHGPENTPASIWRIRLEEAKVIPVVLPGDITLYLEVVR